MYVCVCIYMIYFVRLYCCFLFSLTPMSFKWQTSGQKKLLRSNVYYSKQTHLAWKDTMNKYLATKVPLGLSNDTKTLLLRTPSVLCDLLPCAKTSGHGGGNFFSFTNFFFDESSLSKKTKKILFFFFFLFLFFCFSHIPSSSFFRFILFPFQIHFLLYKMFIVYFQLMIQVCYNSISLQTKVLQLNNVLLGW